MRGAPILSVVCHCDDCQAGWRGTDARPSAHPALVADGGAPYLLFRKDRVEHKAGVERLEAHRIKSTSPTKRVVAACCNSAMYLDFEKGHWLSMCRNRFDGEVPPTQMRIQTQFSRNALAGDVPSYRAYPPQFLARLLRARIAMLFGR